MCPASGPGDPLAAFLEAACVPLDGAHGAGTLERAEELRGAHPELAGLDIHAAAVLGDEVSVRRLLAHDPALATARGGPRGWDALTHLCFSRYLRLERARRPGFLRAAEALLDAGASARTGFFAPGDGAEREWECVLYGAAGIAHDAELTRLLLARGADPNDGEVVYHVPEGRDDDALRVLVASGKLSADSLVTLLLRKADWHDLPAMRWLLAQGADPNRLSRWGKSAFHQAVLRDNSLAICALLLEHGADPGLRWEGRTGIELAARRGRGDVLAAIERRGITLALDGSARLLAACARDDAAAVREFVRAQPALVEALRAEGGELLACFAGSGNTAGLRHLLDLGLDVATPFARGDGYFDIAPDSTALHVAAWRARHASVRLLLERGAPVDRPDGRGRTPLALAVRACVDSYWSDERAPESIEALLRAGASTRGVPFPSGYAEADALLGRAGAGPG